MKALIRRMTSLRFSILAIVMLCWLVPTGLLGVYMGTNFFKLIKPKQRPCLRPVRSKRSFVHRRM